jgi:hypothetical protein
MQTRKTQRKRIRDCTMTRWRSTQDTDAYTDMQNTCALKQNTGYIECTQRKKSGTALRAHRTRYSCRETGTVRWWSKPGVAHTYTVYAVMKHTCGEYKQYMQWWNTHVENTHRTQKYTKRTCTCVCTCTTHTKQAYRHMSTHAHALRTKKEGKQGPYYDHTNVLSA